MRAKAALSVFCVVAALTASQALAQAGLRVPERSEPGLDPAFARGWLAPEYDRFGFLAYQLRDPAAAAPGQRMSWAYSVSPRADFSLTYSNGGSRDFDYDRQVSLYGRWWFSPEWALSAETAARDQPGFLPRIQDLRIGVQRRF